MEAISTCDAVHLLFDRAGIGIYEDVQPIRIFTLAPLKSSPGNFFFPGFAGPLRGFHTISVLAPDIGRFADVLR